MNSKRKKRGSVDDTASPSKRKYSSPGKSRSSPKKSPEKKSPHITSHALSPSETVSPWSQLATNPWISVDGKLVFSEVKPYHLGELLDQAGIEYQSDAVQNATKTLLEKVYTDNYIGGIQVWAEARSRLQSYQPIVAKTRHYSDYAAALGEEKT